jgi:hypothetical protein
MNTHVCRGGVWGGRVSRGWKGRLKGDEGCCWGRRAYGGVLVHRGWPRRKGAAAGSQGGLRGGGGLLGEMGTLIQPQMLVGRPTAPPPLVHPAGPRSAAEPAARAASWRHGAAASRAARTRERRRWSCPTSRGQSAWPRGTARRPMVSVSGARGRGAAGGGRAGEGQGQGSGRQQV